MTFRKRTICKALLPCFSSSWRRSKSVHIHPEVEIWEYELAASASTQSASHLPSRFDPAQGEESGHLTVPMPSGEPNVNTSSSQGQDLDCSTFKNTSCSRLVSYCMSLTHVWIKIKIGCIAFFTPFRPVISQYLLFLPSVFKWVYRRCASRVDDKCWFTPSR